MDYSTWSLLWGIGGPGADDDGDGLPNGAEFAFALNPRNAADAGLFPRPQPVGGGLRLSCVEPAGILGVSYGAAYSVDLQTWTPMPDTGVAPAHEFLTPAAPRLFVRWVISIQP